MILACLPLASCAGFQQERHLAPIFSEFSVAGGDRQIEAVGGSVLVRRRLVGAEVTYSAMRPFYSRRTLGPNESFTRILPPFGQYRRRPEESVFQLLPITRYQRRFPTDGEPTWNLLILPGFYFAKTETGDRRKAFFLFGGIVENFFSFDRAWWIMFPLFAHVERYGRTTRHFLWPFFCFTTDGVGGRPGWRVWPLIGNNYWKGHYNRWFLFWPFFHWQWNDLFFREPARTWMVWPFFGWRVQGESRRWTTLWPFFGYGWERDTGFWAWDGPWPFVVMQNPGTTGQASRFRIWPFYSRYQGDGMLQTNVLWPFFNYRTESYRQSDKVTRNFFPFWQSWTRVDRTGSKSAWRKLWPAYRRFSAERGEELFWAFPALNPFWRLPFIDEHYAWIWELYTVQSNRDQLRQRSWLGLWRRERDKDEDRRSFVGIWARRTYSIRGKIVNETSVLFGLIRWRVSERGRQLLTPAAPGPGWPLQRVPSSLPEAPAAPPSVAGS